MMSTCPFCPHPMMMHDGDGETEHFSCCDNECDCKWEYDTDGNAVML